MDELLDIVDENDKVLGRATRNESCQKGLLHRAVNVIVINSKGEIFLQQRSRKKKTFKLFWDISASEHVKSGESYHQAAERGVLEELGIKIKCRRIRPVHFQDNSFKEVKEKELVELFIAKSNQEMVLDKEEVSGGKFFTIEQISDMVKKKWKFTPWFWDEWMFVKAALA